MKRSILIPIIGGIFIAFLLSPGKAKAEFFSGNTLLQKLSSSDAFDRVHGLGFILGVYDVYVGITICAPENITAGQLKDMIQNYLTNNPAIRHYTAESLINRALQQVWPCKQQQNNNGKRKDA